MRKAKWMALGAVLAGALSPASYAQTETPATKTIFGAWQYVCEVENACQTVLSLADNKTGERMLSWSFVYDRQNDRLSTIVTLPLGVALPPGLAIKLDDGTDLNWAFQVCDVQGCRAVAIIDAATEASLSKTGNVELKFVPYGSRGAVAMPAPMLGFKEAKAKMKADVAGR